MWQYILDLAVEESKRSPIDLMSVYQITLMRSLPREPRFPPTTLPLSAHEKAWQVVTRPTFEIFPR